MVVRGRKKKESVVVVYYGGNDRNPNHTTPHPRPPSIVVPAPMLIRARGTGVLFRKSAM